MSRSFEAGIIERPGFCRMYLNTEEERHGRIRMVIVWGILALMMREMRMKMMMSRFRKFWLGGEGEGRLVD